MKKYIISLFAVLSVFVFSVSVYAGGEPDVTGAADGIVRGARDMTNEDKDGAENNEIRGIDNGAEDESWGIDTRIERRPGVYYADGFGDVNRNNHQYDGINDNNIIGGESRVNDINRMNDGNHINGNIRDNDNNRENDVNRVNYFARAAENEPNANTENNVNENNNINDGVNDNADNNVNANNDNINADDNNNANNDNINADNNANANNTADTTTANTTADTTTANTTTADTTTANTTTTNANVNRNANANTVGNTERNPGTGINLGLVELATIGATMLGTAALASGRKRR